MKVSFKFLEENNICRLVELKGVINGHDYLVGSLVNRNTVRTNLEFICLC